MNERRCKHTIFHIKKRLARLCESSCHAHMHQACDHLFSFCQLLQTYDFDLKDCTHSVVSSQVVSDNALRGTISSSKSLPLQRLCGLCDPLESGNAIATAQSWESTMCLSDAIALQCGFGCHVGHEPVKSGCCRHCGTKCRSGRADGKCHAVSSSHGADEAQVAIV